MFKEYSKVMGYLVLTIVILAAVSGVLYQMGIVGERIAFQNSFQYSEGMDARARTLQSQIDMIDVQLMSNPENYAELQGLKRVLQVQLNATNN